MLGFTKACSDTALDSFETLRSSPSLSAFALIRGSSSSLVGSFSSAAHLKSTSSSSSLSLEDLENIEPSPLLQKAEWLPLLGSLLTEELVRMGYTKNQLLAHLKELQIDFATYEHPVVLTVEAQAKYVGHLGGGLSKNLLLKDKKHRYYVVSALAGTNVDLKVMSQRLGLGKGGLRMAPEEALQEILQVPLGCVTPLALINESSRAVSLLLDQEFKAQECCFFHPLSNDTTISLSASNLDKFLMSIGRNPSYVDLEAHTVVGKENPPDLAAFVPAEVLQLPEQTVKAAVIHVSEQKHVPLEKKLINVREADNMTRGSKKATVLPSNGDVLADATDVRKFIKELIEKTSLAVLSEISKDSKDEGKDPLESAVLDGVNKRISSDLENLAMILKNAAYTQGFQAGIHSRSLRR